MLIIDKTEKHILSFLKLRFPNFLYIPAKKFLPLFPDPISSPNCQPSNIFRILKILNLFLLFPELLFEFLLVLGHQIVRFPTEVVVEEVLLPDLVMLEICVVVRLHSDYYIKGYGWISELGN
jgi:hypothetical protein